MKKGWRERVNRESDGEEVGSVRKKRASCKVRNGYTSEGIKHWKEMTVEIKCLM